RAPRWPSVLGLLDGHGGSLRLLAGGIRATGGPRQLGGRPACGASPCPHQSCVAPQNLALGGPICRRRDQPTVGNTRTPTTVACPQLTRSGCLGRTAGGPQDCCASAELRRRYFRNSLASGP